ncbi:lysoplasmalogenase [Cellulomonas sp. KRMCY2]|uniref:lysoplasmalogenase n=1 Tax=Cellulomonas sp. KRMCY2 TaxID=1304865 RepID=UPI00045E5C23|nr:lysoplasmalogenase [Cellulomonas sp. KRMCY2]
MTSTGRRWPTRTSPASTEPTGAATVAAFACFALVVVVHLLGQLAGLDAVTNPTQWALMPLLALTLWSATRGRSRSRPVRLSMLALGLSWLGDTLPDLAPQDSRFVVMIGCFLLAQVAYIAAFWPYRRRSVLRHPVRAAPYAGVLGLLLVACLPGTGDLLVPAVVYGLCLTTMAALSTGVNRLAAVGGAVFLVSDGLIALDAFALGYDLTGHGFWVMATYVVGQGLIAAGVRRA